MIFVITLNDLITWFLLIMIWLAFPRYKKTTITITVQTL